jgi:hypothetical protein
MDTGNERSPGGTLKSLGLALLNATLILVILAAFALGYAFNALRSFAVDAAQETVSAAVDASGLDPQMISADLEGLTSEVQALRSDLNTGTVDPQTIELLEAQLARFEDLQKFFADPEIRISQTTIDHVGESLNRLLQAVRSCPNVEN